MTHTILREAIIPRIDGIKKNIKRLRQLGKLKFMEFSSGDSYDLAQHHLRLALEGVFHISTHILSRLPGGRAVEYKEIARKMGDMKIVPKAFSTKALIPMAGMRNMLVHAYADIDPEMLYDIVHEHLDGIETFLKHISKVVKQPHKFGIDIN